MHFIFDEFHIAFYAAALMVSFTILMQSIIQKRTDRAHNLAFIVIVCIIMANSITEIVSEFVRPYIMTSDTCMFVDDVCHIIYFMFHSLIAPMFFFYELCLTDAIRKRTDYQVVLFSIPIVIMELMILSNPIDIPTDGICSFNHFSIKPSYLPPPPIEPLNCGDFISYIVPV